MKLVEPPQPGDADNKFHMEKYKQELSQYYEKLDQYEDYKAKVFVIIKGQCSLSMKNKVESMTNYKTWEKSDDVIKLLEALKELSFSMTDVQYEYWTMTRNMKNVLMIKQYDGESLTAYTRNLQTQWM